MPDVKETRTPARFTEPAERAADLDIDSPEVQAFISLLKRRRVAIDPTLSIFESMFTDRPGEVPAAHASVFKRLPPQVRRGMLTGGLPVPAGMDERYRRSFATLVRLVGAIYRAGIPVESGTDALAGFALLREFELHVQAGIPAPEVLRAATLGAAQIMKRDRDLGSIASGKLADLAIVDGDVDSPVWRHRSHVRLNLHHPTDVIVAVNDLGIRRRAAIGLRLPTKELRVKIDRLVWIVSEQLVPTQRVCLTFDADALVLFRLPNAEVSSGWISDHRHASNIHHVERFLDHVGAECFRFRGDLVRVRHTDI